MRRIYKLIVGMLAVGALIAGIGSGVAFAEYSTFEYGGEKVLEGSKRFTKTLKYEVKEKETINITSYYAPITLVENMDVSKDEVRFVIHYLSDQKEVYPEIIEDKIDYSEDGMDYSEEKMEDVVYVVPDYQSIELREIMRMKDPILADIKAHRLSDYQMDGVKTIEVHVNPEADFKINVK